MSSPSSVSLIAALSLLAASCRSKPDVVVTDAGGKPIAGALVEPVTHSLNLAPLTTDARGEVRMAPSIQDIQWVNVRKTGYKDRNSVKFPGPKPVRVTLAP